jgi:hypothetical protein
MNDFPSPVFIGVAGLLTLLLLAIGPALDGAGLVEAAGMPALMAAWAAAVVLIWQPGSSSGDRIPGTSRVVQRLGGQHGSGISVKAGVASEGPPKC